METKIEITCNMSDVTTFYGMLQQSLKKDFEIKKRVEINKHIARAVAALAEDITKYLDQHYPNSTLKDMVMVPRADIDAILEDHELRYQE